MKATAVVLPSEHVGPFDSCEAEAVSLCSLLNGKVLHTFYVCAWALGQMFCALKISFRNCGRVLCVKFFFYWDCWTFGTARKCHSCSAGENPEAGGFSVHQLQSCVVIICS